MNIPHNSTVQSSLKVGQDEKFLSTVSGSISFLVKCLERFNDEHIGNSPIGRFIHYEDLKPEFGVGTNRGKSGKNGRNMKKMGVALVPLVFHFGATSTWILLTGLLAAKSVAIGLLLLVFKIAVSSAKVASFFTKLKSSHMPSPHHEYSWTPHAEHHGFERSLTNIAPYHSHWSPYSPQSNEILPPSYKSITGHHDSSNELEYSKTPSKSLS
ncbi:uncharacterized protein LOC113504318 [Trichoplusia ni]|uniref:Uncharacterized protein LOC113504318 n=1 Tax=Trichoplusia ni TaxID=7111 RepID=A0A7E5WNQ3_TRINI|nr:uncharacterized protein LOC113504318 [Trichoplusia ni]